MSQVCRRQQKNNDFRHKFFDLCVWKHINNNSCWVRVNNLNSNLNPNAVKLFHERAKFICLNYKYLFSSIMAGHGNTIKSTVVQSYCNQAPNTFKSGTWSKGSDNMEGIYDEHLELLEMIKFPFD